MPNSFVLDSNIIFSSLLNLSSPIGKFIITSNSEKIKFYAPEFLTIEIENQLPKLIKISGMTEIEIRKLLQLVYEKIEFISDQIIPFQFYAKALRFVKDVDIDDIVFVALNDYLDSSLLWTGDKALYMALKSKGYKKVIIFENLKKMYNLA